MTRDKFSQVSKKELFKKVKTPIMRKLMGEMLDWAYREGYDGAMDMVYRKEQDEK